MATFKAPDYKTPACESGLGNKSVDIMQYTLKTGDALGDVVKLRKMSSRNTYINVRLAQSAAMAVAATVSLGYVTREVGGTDDPDAFGLNVDTNAATERELIDGVPVEVGEEHDIALTLDTDPAADVGKTYYVIAEFVNASG